MVNILDTDDAIVRRAPVRRDNVAPTRHDITVSVPPKVHERLRDSAAKAGMSLKHFAQVLFDAAYSARCAPTGDRTLDETVAATLILHGVGMDFEAIGRALKVDEDVVDRIVGAWFARDTGGGGA